MPGSAHPTPPPAPPPWNEADSIRETFIFYLDTPEARDTVRSFGRVLYDLALEAAHPVPMDGSEPPSLTRAELRAAAADLRFLEGFLNYVNRSADESSLDPPDEVLARFGGQLARRVAAIAEAIERELR